MGALSIARNTTTPGRALSSRRSAAAGLCYSWALPGGETMRIDPFRMERTQCLYENEVEYNLSESGVLPLRVEDLLEGSPEPEWLLKARLKYPPSRGSDTLRDRIAQFYCAGATRAHVMVTNGGSEANYVAFWGLLEPADRAAIMIPNYLQGWGLARAYASRADSFRLVERRDGQGRRWALDLEGLE